MNQEHSLTWRRYTDWAKQYSFTLQLADFLGRGRGRLRMFDGLNVPPVPRPKPNLANWEQQELAAAWIGHATILLRMNGMTILTDPVMSHRVGIGMGLATLGPRRFVQAALSTAELPKLDLILISHAHFDHLDRPTLNRLNKNVPVIAADQTLDLIRDLGFRKTTELRWGESTSIDGLTITAQKVNHWGARTFLDKHRGYNAYLLDNGKYRVLYGGDTAYGEHFRVISAKSISCDLRHRRKGLRPALHPRAHATPEQAWTMADHVRARFHPASMHHSTFRLSHEPMHEPIQRFIEAAGRDIDRIPIR